MILIKVGLWNLQLICIIRSLASVGLRHAYSIAACVDAQVNCWRKLGLLLLLCFYNSLSNQFRCNYTVINILLWSCRPRWSFRRRRNEWLSHSCSVRLVLLLHFQQLLQHFDNG
eukprot:g24267.t1